MSIDTIQTNLGHFTILGPFNWSQSGATADWGVTLDSGNWDNLKDVPKNDSTTAQYTGPSGKAGGVSCHDGAYDGPLNNADVDGTIIGAEWIWRVRKVVLNPSFKGMYGASTSASTDNTADTPNFTLSTSFQNFRIVKDASDANVPTTSEFFQIGVKKGGGGIMRPADMWPFLLHQEPVVSAEKDAMFHSCDF